MGDYSSGCVVVQLHKSYTGILLAILQAPKVSEAWELRGDCTASDFSVSPPGQQKVPHDLQTQSFPAKDGSFHKQETPI